MNDLGLCSNCNSQATELHHIIPKSLGGSDQESNLVPLCCDCHSKVHRYDLTSMRRLQKIGIEKAKKLGKYKGRKRSVDRVKVCALNTSGYSTYKIAEILSISRMTVHRILNEEGLKHVKVRLKVPHE